MKTPTVCTTPRSRPTRSGLTRIQLDFLRGSNIVPPINIKTRGGHFFQRVEWIPSGQIDEEAASFEKFL